MKSRRIQTAFDQLVPTSLDDIIRINRDKGQIYASTSEELIALKASVPVQFCKGELIDWAYITLSLADQVEKFVFLVGIDCKTHHNLMTSYITAIDGNSIYTKNGSVYKTIGKATKDCNIPFICSILNGWGLGPHFGIPEWFI